MYCMCINVSPNSCTKFLFNDFLGVSNIISPLSSPCLPCFSTSPTRTPMKPQIRTGTNERYSFWTAFPLKKPSIKICNKKYQKILPSVNAIACNCICLFFTPLRTQVALPTPILHVARYHVPLQMPDWLRLETCLRKESAVYISILKNRHSRYHGSHWKLTPCLSCRDAILR